MQVWMVTLGQPRVGNDDFAGLFKSLALDGQAFRYSHNLLTVSFVDLVVQDGLQRRCGCWNS